MSDLKVCCTPGERALGFAARILEEAGIPVTAVPQADTTHLLLPVPTRCFDTLPENVVIVGGNLHCLPGYQVLDLLKDPVYLEENAAITARCAPLLVDVDWPGTSVLILGFGRIGKHLARILTEQGAAVTVAARKETDRALAEKTGYSSLPISQAQGALPTFKVVFNTVPTMILSTAGAPDCIPVELASKPGMVGNRIIDGRGLPGKYAPEASGALIARRFLALVKEEKG